MITISYIHFWNEPPKKMWFTKFLEHNFGPVQIVSYPEPSHILFCSCLGKNINFKNIQNNKSLCKIFFYGENLNNYPLFNNDTLLQKTFDLIVGFKETNTQKKQIRFPLWLMYYPYYNCNNEDNILSYLQTQYEINIKKEKNIFATMVCRHDREGQRTAIYNELSKYGQIKSPGVFKKNTESIGPSKQDKIDYISQSIYNICSENSSSEGYHTEKIIQAFESGTIPLYWAIDLPEKDIINTNKYCFCDVNNIDSLKTNIEDVCKNPEKYINGPLFHKNAHEHVKRMYDELLQYIKEKLNINH